MLRIGGQRVPGISVVLILSEGLLIGLALVAATMLRGLAYDGIDSLIVPGTFLRFLVVVFICGCSLYYFDLYDLQIVGRRSVLFVRLVQALGVGCLLLAFLYYCQPELSLGRGVAAIATPFIILTVLGWRLFVDASAPLFRHRERLLFVGTGSAGVTLAAEIEARPELSLQVVGFMSEHSANRKTNQFQSRVNFSIRGGESVSSSFVSTRPVQFADSHPGPGGATATAAGVAVDAHVAPSPNFSFAADIDDLERFATKEKVDRIIISLPERRGRMPLEALLRLKFSGIPVEEAHTVYERITGRILLDHLSPSWLILSDGFKKPGLMVAAKRTLDILVSFAALVLCAPIMALVATAIWLEDGFPVLFRQERVGLNGKPFTMLKYRSMRATGDSQAPSWTTDSDSRILRVGKLIRRFRLDELPQFINVLRGNMSLIGPRPEQPMFCALLDAEIPYYCQRHTVRPGISGWAQIKYGYGASVEQTRIKLEHDLFYIKHMSVLLDLAIAFETLKVLLSGRGAR